MLKASLVRRLKDSAALWASSRQGLRQTRDLIAPVARPFHETLEPRQFLSAVSLSSGVLTVNIQNQVNSHLIVVEADPGNSADVLVANNSKTFTFAASSVDDVQIKGSTTGANTVQINYDFPERTQANSYFGGNGGNTVYGSSHQDIIQLGTGNNVVYTGAGSDTVNGGNSDGSDTLYGGSGSSILFASDMGNSELVGSSGPDQLIGGATSSANDTIMTSNGNDTVNCAGANVIVLGGSGNSYMTGGTQSDTLYGGSGSSTLVAGTGHTLMIGGSKGSDDHITKTGSIAPARDGGNDSISGSSNSPALRDFIISGAGNDSIESGDSINSANAPDYIYSNNSSDSILSTSSDVLPQNLTYNPGGAIASSVNINLQINHLTADGTSSAFQIPTGAGTFASNSSNSTSIAQAVDSSGDIQFRSNNTDAFTLGDFFRAWGIKFNANNLGQWHTIQGQQISVTVNGVANTDFGHYVVQNGDQIVINVQKVSG